MNYRVSDTDLNNIANAIRNKTNNNNQLVFPNGFISAINGISQTAPGTYIPGILRQDAELMETISYDKLLVQDEGITFPEYSLSTTNIILDWSEYERFSTDYLRQWENTSDYSLILIIESLIIPIYSTNNIPNRLDWAFRIRVNEYLPLSSDELQTLSSPDNSSYLFMTYQNANTTFPLTKYHDANNQVQIASNTAPIYFDCSLPGLCLMSFYQIRLTDPYIRMSGNMTQLGETAWNNLTDIRCQLKIKVYRIARSNSNIDGLYIGSLRSAIIDNILNNNMTLT